MFKQGILVILTAATNPMVADMVGQIHTLGPRSPSYPGSWMLDGVRTRWGAPVSWTEAQMRPLRDPGDDAVDETLEWLPAPEKVSA